MQTVLSPFFSRSSALVTERYLADKGSPSTFGRIPKDSTAGKVGHFGSAT